MYACTIVECLVCHNTVLSILIGALFFLSFRRRYEQIEEIRKGLCLQKKVVLYTYSSGNSCGNLYFIWTVPEDEHESDLLTQSQAVVRKVGATIPTYHTRAMRKQFMIFNYWFTSNPRL